MAGADVNRIGFALKEYRTTAPIEDLQVFSRHPLAVEFDYNTMFQNEADANIFGQQILALRKADRWNWACFVTRGAYPTLEVGQTITLTYPRFGFQNGANFILKKIRRDAGALFDEIVLYGPQGLDFSGNLLAFDFTGGEYWLAGARAMAPSALPGYVFQRAGEQGARDADNKIDWFASGVPAINGMGYHSYDSLTNNFPYSQDFTQDYLLDVTVTVDAAKAPDDTMTMDKIKSSATNTPNHIFGRLVSYGAGSFTQSIFAKAGEHTRLWMGGYDGSVWHSVGFDLAAGKVLPGAEGSAVGFMLDYGGGIYRCIAIVTTAASYGATSGVDFFPKPAAATARDSTFAGNGSDGLYVWGRQLIAGAYQDGGPIIRTLGSGTVALPYSAMFANVKAGGAAIVGDFHVECVVAVNNPGVGRQFAHLYNTGATGNSLFISSWNTNEVGIYGKDNGFIGGLDTSFKTNTTKPIAFIYSMTDSTKTILLGARHNGVTAISNPFSSISTSVSGFNGFNPDFGITNTVLKYAGVKAGSLTAAEMTARLSALLGE